MGSDETKCKGNRRRSIGHCPHLWNPPLQPIHHSQQSILYTACDTSTILKNTTALEHWFIVVVSQSRTLLCRLEWLQWRLT